MFGVWLSPHGTGHPVLVSTSVSSVTLEIQGLNPPAQGDEEDARGFAKNVSRYTMRIPNIWRLVVAA